MNTDELVELSKHAFEMIAQIVAYVKAAHDGVVKPDEALAKIGELHNEILADRAAIDKQVDEKFDAEP